eukprot:CAMPEP_0170235872 /NCGR_PEP_ID=MMETSP0116_2-20130129/17682_1 /TAXON_ID=400756 /ORGANISM="Durinskia baltica, Strain CSIRO CS-38" /LENGTH=47 /DNA_ID= /DNA_START= /DNA_END= /DNA_ORIENTATION=
MLNSEKEDLRFISKFAASALHTLLVVIAGAAGLAVATGETSWGAVKT